MRGWLMFAALAGLSAVGMGAFAAHGLKARLSPESLAVIQTGVQYQLWHALALVITSYSIHYTKLYEGTLRRWPQGPGGHRHRHGQCRRLGCPPSGGGAADGKHQRPGAFSMSKTLTSYNFV